MTEQSTGVAVRHSLTVQAPPTRAFEVFTDRLGTWWPLQSHTIGSDPAVTAVIEPRVGGRWFERSEAGVECDWGRVLAWDPPHRLVLSWEISADWRADPSVASEVEIRFEPEGADATRVELEHRGLEVYGDQAAQMRDTFGGPGGWPGLTAAFAAALDGSGTRTPAR